MTPNAGCIDKTIDGDPPPRRYLITCQDCHYAIVYYVGRDMTYGRQAKSIHLRQNSAFHLALSNCLISHSYLQPHVQT